MAATRHTVATFVAVILSIACGFFASSALAADFYFEFYNGGTNKTESTYPLGVPVEIIVASQTQDVTKRLPIGIVIRADSDRYKNAIPNNAEQFCRGPDGCSIPGPNIPKANYLEISAITENGQVLATYTKGTPPAEPAMVPVTTPTTTARTILLPTTSAPPAPLPVTESTPVATPPQNPVTPTIPDAGGGNNREAVLAILVLMLLVGAGAGIFLSTTGDGCADTCKLGACRSCELNNLMLATHGTKKGEEDDLVDLGKLLLDLLGLAPLPSAGPSGKGLTGGIGGTVSKPVIKEGLEKAADILKRRSGMGTWGVDIWARLELVKCQQVICWPYFWRNKTVWVSEFTEVKIEPPDAYRHRGGGSDVGWNYHYLFSPKENDRRTIGRKIRELALKHCGDCPHASKV